MIRKLYVYIRMRTTKIDSDGGGVRQKQLLLTNIPATLFASKYEQDDSDGHHYGGINYVHDPVTEGEVPCTFWEFPRDDPVATLKQHLIA